jgi:hypothetical protein
VSYIVWTQDKLDFLTANYLQMKYTQIAEALGLTHNAVRIKASKLGLRKPMLKIEGNKRQEYTRRYRAKTVAEGRCPHCGKPCAPRYYCSEFLAGKRERWASYGRFKRIEKEARKKNYFNRTATGTVTRIGNVTVHRLAA